MKEFIRSTAVFIAVAVCFFVAIIGSFCGVDPAMCCYRAVCGAIFAYCIATVGLSIGARVVLEAIVESKMKNQKEKQETEGE